MKLRRKSSGGVTYSDILLARNEEEAEKLLRKYVRSNPTDIAAYVRLGDILRRRNLFDEAVKIHKLLLKPRMGAEIKIRVLQSLVDDLFRARRFKESIPYLNELIGLKRNDISYQNLLAGVYEQTKMWDEAIVLRKRLGNRKNLACLHAYYGKFLFDDEQMKKATQNFQRAIKLDPSCVPALIYMGDVKYKDGNVDSAIELWQRIIKDSPEFAFLTFDRLENAYFEKKSFHDMVEVYQLCIQKSDSIESYRRLAGLYNKLGERDKSIQILTKALERNRDESTAFQLAEVYRDSGDYEKALKSIEEVLGEKTKGNIYQCENCKSEFEDFYFRCDRCFEWLTLREMIRV